MCFKEFSNIFEALTFEMSRYSGINTDPFALVFSRWLAGEA